MSHHQSIKWEFDKVVNPIEKQSGKYKRCNSKYVIVISHAKLQMNVWMSVSRWKWNKRWSPSFPCCPVSRQCPWKKTLIEKKNHFHTFLLCCYICFLLLYILDLCLFHMHVSSVWFDCILLSSLAVKSILLTFSVNTLFLASKYFLQF